MSPRTAPALALDHLVIAARTLVEAVDWCEAVLGVRAEGGGRHAFMGTHNRVVAIASARFPRAYLELIAVDAEAPRPVHPRWFDLDDEGLQSALARRGPQLVQWVARCHNLETAGEAMRAGGIDGGVPRRAERATPQGLLRWRIGVRADGRRPLNGAAPALIEWGDMHPTDAMPSDGGLHLESMRLAGWPRGLRAMLPAAIDPVDSPGAPPIEVTLATPRGPVTLESLS
jgi:hypothetical protein